MRPLHAVRQHPYAPSESAAPAAGPAGEKAAPAVVMHIVVRRRAVAQPHALSMMRIPLYEDSNNNGSRKKARTVADVLDELRRSLRLTTAENNGSGGVVVVINNNDDLLPANAAVLVWPPARPLYGTAPGPPQQQRSGGGPPAALVPQTARLVDLCALYAGVALPAEIDAMRARDADDAPLLARLGPAFAAETSGRGLLGSNGAYCCCTLEVYAGWGRELYAPAAHFGALPPPLSVVPGKGAPSAAEAAAAVARRAAERVRAFARFFSAQTRGAQARPVCWPPLDVDWMIRDPARRHAARPFRRYADLFQDMHRFWAQPHQ